MPLSIATACHVVLRGVRFGGVVVSIDEALGGLGRRISVRRVVGTRDGRPLFTDAVGVLESVDSDEVVLRVRGGGTVAFPRGSVVAAKVVPARGLRLTGRELEEIAAEGWRGLEAERLGDWLMRAGNGFTGRANSVLLVGEPGLRRPQAVALVQAWYHARGLPTKFQVPLPDSAVTDRWLAEQGWSAFDEVRVLVADLDHLLGLQRPVDQDRWRVQVEARPDDAWVAAYHYRGGSLPGYARPVIENGDHLGFASVRAVGDGDDVLAIARGSVDRRWLGVTAVEVAPSARRQGLAGLALGALAEWADALGAHSCYLQVAVENAPALALYQRAGFVDHHRYHYRQRPQHQS